MIGAKPQLRLNPSDYDCYFPTVICTIVVKKGGTVIDRLGEFCEALLLHRHSVALS